LYKKLLKAITSSLSKGAMRRLAPFDPQKAPEAKAVNQLRVQWQDQEKGRAREELGILGQKASPNARKRALGKLASNTVVRRAADGGREFLLHRGMGTDEFRRGHSKDASGKHRINHRVSDKGAYTSWTPHLSVARDVFDPGEGKGGIASAWVHENSIRMVPNQYGSYTNDPADSYQHEHEVIVAPNHNSELVHRDEVGKVTGVNKENLRPTPSNIDQMINERSSRGAASNYIKEIAREFQSRRRKPVLKSDPMGMASAINMKKTAIPQKTKTNFHTPEQVIEHLHEHDSTGDDDFLYNLESQIRKHPSWELTHIDPRKHTDYSSGSSDPEIVNEYRHMNTVPPAIIAVPGGGGRHQILDGMHRATAAARNKGIIPAFVPTGSIRTPSTSTARKPMRKLESLMKPYRSDAQRRWAHTNAGKKALGGESAVHHWDEATKGKHLPERLAKAPVVSEVYGTHTINPDWATQHRGRYLGSKKFKGKIVHMHLEDANPNLPPIKHYTITGNSDPNARAVSQISVKAHNFDEGMNYPHIAFAATSPKYEGRGLSTLLHQFAATQHGKVGSDIRLSPGSEKVWRSKVAQDPDFGVKHAKTISGDSPESGTGSYDTSHFLTHKPMGKSGYGPKGGGQYTAADNVRRKQSNANDVITAPGSVKVKTGANVSGGQGKQRLNQEVRAIHAKNRKQPVRQFSPEEIAGLNAVRGMKKTAKVIPIKKPTDPVLDPKAPQGNTDPKWNRKAMAWIEKQKGLKKSGDQNMGPHIIFSAENSPYPDRVRSKATHEQVLGLLRSRGEDAREVRGHYGSPERSIMVMRPKRPESIQRIASELGQESIIHSDGANHRMVYLHGPSAGQEVSGSGTVWHKEKPADMYTTVGGRHFTHNFNFKKGELQKRSKNVREKTRNLTHDERQARMVRYMARQGIKARQGNQDRFGVGPKQNEVLYTPGRGMPEHEYAHQLMTPTGMKPRQYQKQLGQVSSSSGMPQEQRVADESTAFMMQPSLARLAGVKAQDTKNIGMLSPEDRTKYSARAKAILDTKVFKSELVKNEAADAETERINENKKSPEARSLHRFRAAEWTHPNGHPRCLLCGDEERTGDMCEGAE
jgi:hypothetical protein